VKELEVLDDWLKDMLETGKIRASKLPARLPIVFMPKPHGRGLRLYIDYRRSNKIAIANHYSVLIMSELQEHIRGARIFTKNGLEEWLPFDPCEKRGQMDNHLLVPVQSLLVHDDAIWLTQCSSYLPGYDESFLNRLTR
jgi:hypothetical protein